jgi:hypothetical protein
MAFQDLLQLTCFRTTMLWKGYNIRAVLSALPVMILLPEGLNDTFEISPLWPFAHIKRIPSNEAICSPEWTL